MALKDVKTSRSGSRGKGRHVTREEAKDGARRIRREEDKEETSIRVTCSMEGCGYPAMIMEYHCHGPLCRDHMLDVELSEHRTPKKD